MRKLIIFFLIIVIASCKSVKKVEAIHASISKKDTAQTIIVADVPKIDSAIIVKGIMEKVMKRKIDFNTFNSKIKVDYEGSENNAHVTAYVSIQKDTIIYVKITHPLAGLVAQILITKDSVFTMDGKKKDLQKRSIGFLQEQTKIPFNFSTLQDVLVGNPVFLDSNVVSYKSLPSQLLVMMVGEQFKHLLTLDNNDYKVIHSKLDDVDANRNRTCDITFSNYQLISNWTFAAYRKITVSEKSKLDISLDYKEVSFNDGLKYTFSIPKNSKHK